MVILSADLLLWLNAVTEDTVHAEIELERAQRGQTNITDPSDDDSSGSGGTDKGLDRFRVRAAVCWSPGAELRFV